MDIEETERYIVLQRDERGERLGALTPKEDLAQQGSSSLSGPENAIWGHFIDNDMCTHNYSCVCGHV